MTKSTIDEMNKDAKGAYTSKNGLNMSYEIHGTGRPLVLLHGALSAIDTSFGKVLLALGGHQDQMRRNGGSKR